MLLLYYHILKVANCKKNIIKMKKSKKVKKSILSYYYIFIYNHILKFAK